MAIAIRSHSEISYRILSAGVFTNRLAVREPPPSRRRDFSTGSARPMDLAASVPSFEAGTSLWALALVLISIPRVFPLPVRLLGLFAAVLFGATAVQIFAGVQVMPTTSPLPFYAYPVFVATLVGWIWTLVKGDRSPSAMG